MNTTNENAAACTAVAPDTGSSATLCTSPDFRASASDQPAPGLGTLASLREPSASARPNQPAPVPNLIAGRARVGKVARLPKAVREKINRMLDDNIPYRQIIQALGPDGSGLTIDNISNWRSGGYQDWLRDQFVLRQACLKHEAVAGMLASTPPDKLHQATATIAASQLTELLLDFKSVALHASLAKHPEVYARLINAAARLSDGHIHMDNHRRELAEAALQVLKAKRAALQPPQAQPPSLPSDNNSQNP